MNSLIVQIPAYNEEKSIGKVIQGIPRRIRGISNVKILVTDDASLDNTINEAKKAGADYIIKHNHNQGLGKNFKDGIEHCLKLGADIIVNIDGDGQFNSKDIPKLIKPLLDGEADIATCSRFLKPELTKDMPILKKWGNKRYTNLIKRITGENFTDTQCGYRAYSREAALKLNLHGKFTYTQESFIDLVSKGMRIKEIPLEVVYNKERKSLISGNLIRYGLKTLGIITRATRDTQPLTFFGVPSMILFFLGLIGSSFSFWFWVTHLMTTPIRQLFNVSVFFLIFGVSLGVLGLLADMLLTIKKNQDEICYRLKKKEFEGR